MFLRRAVLTCFAFVLICLPGPAFADVVVTFWSHERDQNYPHAFMVLRGTVEATGELVDTNIGFTARSASPMVLLGSVTGQMETVSSAYIARPASRPHFSVTIDDGGYARLMAFVARWRAAPQPSYNLNRRNCVHFVMEAAVLLGLAVNRRSAHFREPRYFLEEVARLNPGLRRVSR